MTQKPAGAFSGLKNSIYEQWHARRGFFGPQKSNFRAVACPQGLFWTSKIAFLSSNMPAGAFLYQKNGISEQWHAHRGFFVSKKMHFWAVTCPQGFFCTPKITFPRGNGGVCGFRVPRSAFWLVCGPLATAFRVLASGSDSRWWPRQPPHCGECRTWGCGWRCQLVARDGGKSEARRWPSYLTRTRNLRFR